eukprot:TRINITY_DN3997_c0_g2_i1.p1 TRINITY_DN3997_c0_g2~~TRINITY_DN3997_c0_g2_i1.p1  ORF type:complete len:197 (+),score=61.58 TRINITY_DN3997_c0_g2_i1:63-653(+)
MGNANKKLNENDLALLKNTESSTGMDKKALLKEYKKFKKQFPTGGINKEQFREMAGSFLPPQQRSEEFINRLFNAFDSDRSGQVDFHEFMLAMTMCSSDNPEDKLRFCFRSLDIDASGYLDRQEILYAVQLIFKHNPGLEKRVAPDVNTPEKVVTKIFESVDQNGDNKLTCEELIEFMHNDPKTFSYLGLNLIFLT